MEEKCFYCEREFNIKNYGTNKSCAKTIDHIIPISKGGRNNDKNKVDACAECNTLKGNLTLDEFKKVVKELIVKKITHYKTIPANRFLLIIKNIRELKRYVDKKWDSLYLLNHTEPTYNGNLDYFFNKVYKKKKRSLVGEHLERVKKSETILSDTNILTKRMEQAYGHDFNVNKPTEKDLFLMHQTEIQLQLSKKFGWKVAQMMTEPELNFHY